LRLQIPKDTGLSILDARGNLLYVALYKKNRCSIKPQLISNQHAQQLIKKYQNYGVYIQYKSVDIFENLIKHINEFKLVKNVLVLQPLYIKKPL
jgi:tRNA A37 threonylcarbamoyladenosine modification protein TsaB